MLERLEAKVASILTTRRLDRMTRRYGGTQKCTWCRQCVQDGDGWSFKPFPEDFSLDVLTCGVCGGTSLWRWGMGMHFISPLDPPTPAFQAVEVVHARSRDTVEARQQAQAALDKVMQQRFSNFDAGAVIHWAERGLYQVKPAPSPQPSKGGQSMAHEIPYVCDSCTTGHGSTCRCSPPQSSVPKETP